MAIDFLGKPKPVKKKVDPGVEYYVPEKDKAQKAEPIKKEIVKKAEPPKPKEELGEVNLMTAFKKYLRRRREIATIISVIIVLAMIIGGYFLYIYIVTLPPAPPAINLPVNINKPVINENINTTPPPPLPKYSCNTNSGQCFNDVNGVFANFNDCQANCFVPTPLPVCGNGICENNENTQNCLIDCPPLVLPDTELSSLRGALVRFLNDNNIYLIEYNGELRNIDKQTVRFKNGQTISQLNPKLIYTLAVRFADTRKGKDVKGFIDWDPRVLTEQELLPFIK